jgi:hypothetical protein
MPLTVKAVAEYSFDLQVGLEGVDVPEYDVAKAIGMAAVLAVNLRGLGELQYQSLRLVAAHYFHIRSDVLDGVLHTLAELELVKLVTSGTSIQQVIPTVPHFEDVYARIGELASVRPLNELEQLTIEMLDRLYKAPVNKDSLVSKLGADPSAFESSLQIGVDAGLMTSNRVRGRNIIASPLYFSGNLDGLLDIAARGDTPTVSRLLTLISKNQGMPLSSIVKEQSLSGTPLSPDDLALLQSLARDGVIKPPSIIRPNKQEEHFIFTPAPGKTRLSAANREIYEKGMAIAAAVRKGQLLPEAYRIRLPQALLYRLRDRKWIDANTEAAHQYKNLAVLGVGRLEHVGGGFHRFHLIDVPENIEAVNIAKTLLAGEQPADLEQDKNARLLLSESDVYVKSHLSSAALRSTKTSKPVISRKAKDEMEQLLLAL